MRVVLAEDLPLLRDGLIRLFEANGILVVEAVDERAWLARSLQENRPDLALADVRLAPGYSDEGLRTILDARRDGRVQPALLVAQHVELQHARQLLADRSAGVGYLSKDRLFDVDRLLEIMRQVSAGGVVMDPEIVAQLLALRSAPDDPLTTLLPRERELLTLLAEGRTTPAIATELFTSDDSIAKQIDIVFTKLGLLQPDDDQRRTMALLDYLDVVD